MAGLLPCALTVMSFKGLVSFAGIQRGKRVTMDNAATVYTLEQLQDMRSKAYRAMTAIGDVYTMPGSSMTHRAWITAHNSLNAEVERVNELINRYFESL